MTMKAPHSRIVITALRGGAGKTTLSAGILAALKKRGILAVPFKKGPDYIDAAWLSSASGQACHNLDSFLMDKQTILSSFIRNSSGADMALIEGNRGLFDGMDSLGTHSTAELAKLLVSPVVMIMDCDKVTRTAAAMILGCRMLDPGVDFRGIILNRVSGSRHENILRKTIEETCSLPVIGAVPRMKDFPFPQRNLGLTPPQEHSQMMYALETVAGVAEKYIDLDMIISTATQASGTLETDIPAVRRIKPTGATIGVLRDSAFQFYYPENLEALKDRGVKVIDISPLSDTGLSDIDLLYIGGGFPETHAEALTQNATFRTSLRKAAEKGLPIYAECGGLMYLGETLLIGGREYPMAGALPVSFAMVDKPQGHGYTIMDVVAENPYFPVGGTIRGHEFHHSKIVSLDEKQISFAFRMNRGTGIEGMRDGLCKNQILASYTHIHALGTPQWADALIGRADEYRDQKKKRTVLDLTKHHINTGYMNRVTASTTIQQ
jgi:cobyrinic acid a,c-diamide synthase